VFVKQGNTFHEFMPEDVWKWKLLERRIEQVLALHDYEEIRLSVLQDYNVMYSGITALMQGHEAESVVEKTLTLCQPDEDISLLSLRPEGTISVLHHTARIMKDKDVHRFYYHGPMFRKDRNRRPMEFYQLGVELLGSDSILSENEVISLGMKLLGEIGLKDVTLKLNSFGCEVCRQPFFQDMRAFLKEHEDHYCRSCYDELYANPFADTRCSDSACLHHALSGPKIGDYLCKKCKENFNKIKKIQANLAHPYRVDPHLFKNFVYYNETVFDFVTKPGEQEIIIGGGGRYDYLSAKITGRKIPAVGFYLNLDTIYGLMDSRRSFAMPDRSFSVYLCAQSPDLEMMMLQIAHELHQHRIKTVLSTEIGTTEAELAHARKKQCELMLIIREDNIREGKLLLRNLAKDHQAYVPLNQITDEIQLARKSLKKD
jgi:histidyl-tRNA synthetase